MRAVASCRVACGPTAQPAAPLSASRRGRPASSIAQPPPLLTVQQQPRPPAGPLATRPAVVFIPPAVETGGQVRPTAADCVSSSCSGSSLAGGHLEHQHLAALRHGEQQHSEQQERQQQHHQQPQQQQHRQQDEQQRRGGALGGHWQLALGAQLAVDADVATTSSSSSPLNVQLNEQLPQQQSPPPPGEDRDKDFFANVGDAIRTLREDYPLLFVKSLNCEWAQLGPWAAAGALGAVCTCS